jgi:hypothetical protein
VLVSAGVQEGDLLAATEGGARMIAVRCASTCQVTEVAQGPSPAHGGGHLLVVADHPRPGAPSLPQAADLGSAARTQAILLRVGVAVLGATGLLVLLLVVRRQRRRIP